MKHKLTAYTDLRNGNENETVVKTTEVQDECDSKSH